MKKLLFLSIVMFAVASTAFTADTPPPAPMQDGIITFNNNDIKEFDPKGILRKGPINPEKLNINSYFMLPRQLLRLHKHPGSDEVFFVVEGEGQFTVGNNKTMVKAGSVVYGPADVPHGIVNSGKENMVVVSVQGPKPVKITWTENGSAICPICGQENIVPEGAKVGDIVTCPRCHQKFKLAKGADGKWIGNKI